MAKVVEAETVAVWNLDHLLGCRSEMIFPSMFGTRGCLPLSRSEAKTKSSSPA